MHELSVALAVPFNQLVAVALVGRDDGGRVTLVTLAVFTLENELELRIGDGLWLVAVDEAAPGRGKRLNIPCFDMVVPVVELPESPMIPIGTRSPMLVTLGPASAEVVVRLGEIVVRVAKLDGL